MNEITQAELKTLQAVATEAEWNAACDQIMKAHDGKYPSDWAEKVLFSGLKTQIDLSIQFNVKERS